MDQRRSLAFVVLALACALYVATAVAQTRVRTDRETGRSSHRDLSGAAVERINSRLPKGRVVEVSPRLTEGDVRVPDALSHLSERIVPLPTGLPLVTVQIDDDATIARGQGETIDLETQAVVFMQRADSGFVLTNKDDEGNFIANQLFLGNGFYAGASIIGYDLLLYNDPTSGPASVKVSLWDGDPLGIVDTRCNETPMSIPGTGVTFTDLPPANDVCPATGRFQEPSCVGLYRLTATFPNSVKIDCDHVWMVLEVTQGCLVGWRTNASIYYRPGIQWSAAPEIGRSDFIETLTGQDTKDGNCCDGGASDGGQACNHTDTDTSNDCPRGPTFCTDGIADFPTAFSFGFLGGGYYASLVAGVFSPPNARIAVLPVGNTFDGKLGPGVVISGNEIRLPSGDHTVFLEVRLGDWDPNDQGVALKAYRLYLDTSAYTSGLQGTLDVARLPCAANAECEREFGPGFTCDFPAGCGFLGTQCFCTPGSIDLGRPDSAFPRFALCFADHSNSKFRMGCSLISGALDDPEPFPASGMYAATWVIGVPADARGTFTFGLRTISGLADGYNLPIPLIARIPAKIVIVDGRCCHDLDGAVQCADGVTENECNDMPSPRSFTPGGTCHDDLDVCLDCNENGQIDSEDIGSGQSSDCNANGRPDECEVPPLAPLGIDCNANGVPDLCDVPPISPLGLDCNKNGFPDACELPPIAVLGQDCNDNGIPDECDVDCDGNGIADNCDPKFCTTLLTDRPRQADGTRARCRYLSITPGGRSCNVAIRVSFDGIPPPFQHLEGLTMWAGPPFEVCEHHGQVAPPPEGCAPAPGLPSRSFWASELQCEPHFTNFGELETLHLFGEEIVPDGFFSVARVRQGCSAGVISPGLATTVWGNVAGTFSAVNNRWQEPDFRVDLTTDVIALLEKFANRPGAPFTAAADVAPARPDGLIDIAVDVIYVIDAFRGLPYPFDAPDPCRE